MGLGRGKPRAQDELLELLHDAHLPCCRDAEMEVDDSRFPCLSGESSACEVLLQLDSQRFQVVAIEPRNRSLVLGLRGRDRPVEVDFEPLENIAITVLLDGAGRRSETPADGLFSPVRVVLWVSEPCRDLVRDLSVVPRPFLEGYDLVVLLRPIDVRDCSTCGRSPSAIKCQSDLI